MTTPSTETVLITGASSGIGLELAKLFAADGSRLVLVARREAQLRTLADELKAARGAACEIVPFDLARPDAAGELVNELKARGLDVDVLVNNAGFGGHGKFADIPLDRQLAMIRLNVEALVALTHLLLPGMLARRRGGVLNVASTAGFVPGGPTMATYYATKAFVLSHSQALADELRGTGVTMTCLCPGPTRTEFADVADVAKSKLFTGGMGLMDAAPVARLGHAGFRRGRAVVVTGLSNRLGVFGMRFLPGASIRKIVASLHT